MAPRTGFEPVTYRLTAGCSTAELSGNTRIARGNPHNEVGVYYERSHKSQNFFQEKSIHEI